MVEIVVTHASRLQQIPQGSNNYTRAFNDNLAALTMLFQPAVESRTAPVPASADPGTSYIDPATGQLLMWFPEIEEGIVYPEPVPDRPAGWRALPAQPGFQVYVKDEDKVYLYHETQGWMLLVDLGAEHRGIEREFSFYAPYALRQNSVLFRYTAGLEFTIEAGAPNSGAALEVAPTGDVILPILRNGTVIGSITFLAGQTAGTISFPDEVIVQPSHEETMYVSANSLEILSPANVFGAQGLSVTLRGKIRAID